MAQVLALDIGGSKIAAALVDESGRLTAPRRTPTLAQEGAEAILGRVIALAQEALAASGGLAPIAVGVGTGGQVDPRSGQIVHATPLLPGWTGLPLRARLEEALGLPVAIANDVHAMGLGEGVHGAGKGIRHLLCLAVGTGIGGAYLEEGRLMLGSRGGAGHLGHVSIDALGGRRCSCGSVGCVESYAAAPAIVTDWMQKVGPANVRRWLAKPANAITVEDLAALIRRHDEASETAYAALHRAGWYLGVAVVSLLHTFNPEAVVIGGGVAQVGEPFFSGVRQAIKERAIPSFRHARVLPAALGPDAALVGAAVLALGLGASGESNAP